MYISSLSFRLNQTADADPINIILTKKTMDTETQNSANLIKMMELSANPQLGKNIDFKA